MDHLRAHPTAALVGLAGLVAIVLALGGWYLARNSAALVELREQAAAVMSPVMAAAPAERWQVAPGSVLMLRQDTPRAAPIVNAFPDPLDAYPGAYGPAERRRREVRLSAGVDHAAAFRATFDAAMRVELDATFDAAIAGPVEQHEVVDHAGADVSWGDTLHAIVESDDRGQLLPAGMADPAVEAVWLALTDDAIEQARDDAAWAAEWRRVDAVIAADVVRLDAALAALMGPKLVAESRQIRQRRDQLAAAYISGEFARPVVASTPSPRPVRQTSAQAKRARKRANAAKGRPALVSA